MLRKVAFTLYPVSDMKAARAFYEVVLGLESAAGVSSPWVEYDLPGGGCFAITTVMPVSPNPASGAMIAFEVDNLDATIAQVRAKGGRLAGGEVVKGPHCRMLNVFDPDGHTMILHQLDQAVASA